MKLLSFVPVVVAALVFADTLQYDTNYDDERHSLNCIACSDGANGFITNGYTILACADLRLPPFLAQHRRLFRRRGLELGEL